MSVANTWGPKSIIICEEGGEMVIRERSTENSAALGLTLGLELRDLTVEHERVMQLERIASQPQRYKKLRSKPKRALGGRARLDWIARRAGLTVERVRELLAEADHIQTARARAGLPT